jgi:hypothetical protein
MRLVPVGVIVLALSVTLWPAAAAPPPRGRAMLEDQVRWAWAIEKNKGQLAAMMAARRQNALPKDSAEPLIPQTQAFAGSLKAKAPSLLRDLLASLSRMEEVVQHGADAAALQAAAEAAVRAHDRAFVALIVPATRDSLVFRAGVLTRLTADVSDEYEEWLDGKDPADWFQSWGMLQRSKTYWQGLRPEMHRKSPRQAAEVDDRMATLDGAVGSPVPPRVAPGVDPDDLDEAATDIEASLSEWVGSPVGFHRTPAQNVKLVGALVEQARTAYRAGSREMGVELVYDAFNDHYDGELAGAPLRAVAPELARRIGPGLHQLLQQMAGGAPSGEIDAAIASLLPALGKAEEALAHP